MILGEIARLERMLVIVTLRAADHHKTLFATNDVTRPGCITLTDQHSPACLFESRPRAEEVAYQLEHWGCAAASVRRVSIVTVVEDARPEA